MFKTLFLGIFSFVVFNTNTTKSELADTITYDNAICRVTCTISVPNPTGPGTVGFSATAGNFLMSCESAREKACKKAFENAMDILMDL